MSDSFPVIPSSLEPTNQTSFFTLYLTVIFELKLWFCCLCLLDFGQPSQIGVCFSPPPYLLLSWAGEQLGLVVVPLWVHSIGQIQRNWVWGRVWRLGSRRLVLIWVLTEMGNINSLKSDGGGGGQVARKVAEYGEHTARNQTPLLSLGVPALDHMNYQQRE
ncbi:hypothetical protein E2542_SST14407 [Spatholobus suberectus]|nr:hypothetical protein E2542_SST14407 [Spatholobus suberectus]